MTLDELKKLCDLECTSWPEGDWQDCCIAHDYAYAEGVNKWKADFQLAVCVSKKGKLRLTHLGIAVLMWIGVTIGGWKPYNNYKELRKTNEQ